MAAALFDPEGGYYSRNIRDIGRHGDFSTTATLHPVLGQALAAWIGAGLKQSGMKPPWHIIEVGGGNGALAAQILKALPWRIRWRLHYHLVEKSPVLERLQRQRLRVCPVRWHRGMEESLEEAKGEALIFSNELVDAFPAVVVRKSGGIWRECALEEKGTGLGSCMREVDALRLPTASFQALYWTEAVEGQCCELHASYREWMQAWAPRWKRGRMLTIDYGGTLPELYHRRPSGTLRAYFAHQILEDLEVFARPGLQDITADVNFSDLQTWGEELGWENAYCCTQADFLRAWAHESCKPSARRPEIEFLLSADGAGGAFRVLEQRCPGGS
jgi:SAM-dependent MidA family methyltransferase